MDKFYVVSDDILYRREVFGSLVYNFGSSRYYQFNKDASTIIEILIQPLILEEIKSKIEQLLDVVAPNDVLNKSLQNLISKGIINLQYGRRPEISKAMLFFTDVEDFVPNTLYMPTIVGAYLTYRCTGFCKHCVSESSINRDIHGEMNYGEWTKALLRLRENGVIYLVLTGGDPLCNKDWKSILRVADELKFRTILLNDLKLFQKDDCRIIAGLRYFDHIQVSIDGPTAELHDFMRGKNSFSILIEKIKILRQANIKFNVACTIHRGNIFSIRKMAEFAKEIGAQKVWFNPIALYGRGVNQNDIALSKEDLGKLSKEYVLIVKEGIIEPGNSYWKLAARELTDFNAPFNPLANNPTSVSLATYNMSLDPYGDCYPDSKFRAMKQYRLGNILTNSMKQMWHSPDLQNLRNKFRFGGWAFADLNDLVSDIPELADVLRDENK